MSIQLRSTAPRIPTPSSTTSRRTATGVDQAPAEIEHNCRTILESLQAEDGGPLAFFKNAGTQLKADERIKVEHYVSTIYSLLMKQTSELASSCTISPSTTLSLQFYALECLLENKTYFALSTTEQEASSDNDKPVQSLASSLHRAVVSFGKSSTANASSESEIALQLSTKLSPLLTHIDEVIKPKDRLRKCQTFLEVIDLLVQLYGRGQLDPQPLQAMITEVRSTRHTIPEGPDDAESKNSIAWERDAIALCSRLSTHVTNLERWISSSFAFKQFDPTLTQQCMMQAGDALAYSGSIAECPENKSSDKIRQNLVRSLERSHHYAYRAYKAIQKDDSTSTMLKTPASSVLKDLLGSFCEIATSSKVTSGILARAIDTWLLFAHKDLDASNSATFRIVYAHVKQAESTLNQMGLDSDRALSQRTLASSTYTIGRSLYNAERYANAIPFLKMSCILTDTIDSVTQDSNSREIHGDTADRAPGRWELLGSAYAQCKEMDDALNAYVKSLRGFFARLSHPRGQKASIDPDFQRVLAKYTRLSVVDKLLEPSGAAAVVVLADMDLDPMTRGYLLESQASCLQDYLHKSEAANAASHWLSEAEATFVQCQAGSELARYVAHGLVVYYVEADLPLRVLFRSMHLAVSRPRDGASTCRAAELGARIISVCTAQESLSWATQYAALARLLLIINSVKRQDPTASKQMAKHAKEALSAFRSTLSFSNSISSPQGQSADRESVRQTAHLENKKPAPLTSKLEKAHRTLETTVSTRKPLSPRRAASSSANRIVTPPRQKEKIPETPVKKQVLGTTFSQLQMPRETMSLLSTVASLLGLFEHTFLRLGYLRLLKNIYDSHSPENFIDICLELAAEYRKLGKLSRAHTMLAHAEYTATTWDLSVEARTMLLLRKAEHLAYNDDPSKG